MSVMNDDQKQKEWQRIAEEAEQGNDQAASSVTEEESDEEGVEEEVSGAGTAGQLEHPSYKALEEQLTATEAKMHEQRLRLQAELTNLQRRMDESIEKAHKYALKEFSSELLPVMDSLEQALQLQVDDDTVAQQMHQGIELTLKLFLSVLQKFGIEQLDPVGETFDPKHHEAIAMQEQEGMAANTIISVFQKGYLLNGRVIRPARVVVAK